MDTNGTEGGQRALSLASHGRISHTHPRAGRGAAPAPLECDSTLAVHQASFYVPDTEALFNLRAPTRSGPKAGVAPPSLAHPEFDSGTPSLPEPGILNTLQREDYFFSGFSTCLQTLGVWLQGRDEVTRLSSWASGVCGDLYPTNALTFLPRVSRCPQGGGELQAKSRPLFPPHAPLYKEHRRLSCLSSTYFSFFLFLILSVLPLHPRDHVA